MLLLSKGRTVEDKKEKEVMDSYWSKVLSGRISRRRAMGASLAGGAGAAILAACGDGGDSGDGGDGASGGSSLVSKIVNTSSEAMRGGTYVYPARREPLHFD